MTTAQRKILSALSIRAASGREEKVLLTGSGSLQAARALERRGLVSVFKDCVTASPAGNWDGFDWFAVSAKKAVR